MGATLVTLMCLLVIAGQGDEEAAERGRIFYRTGTTVDQQRVEAWMGQPPTAVPASVLPCQNCHGQRGHGRPEGGMIPADITWDSLTRPYDLLTESGRRRPAYSVPLLIRAITQGLDSAGTPLDPNMPRYQLDEGQAHDLIAWLRRMDAVKDPGIDEKTLSIGLVGPDGTSPARMDAETTWQAFAAELAAKGGIYGRALKLHRLTLTGLPQEDTAALEDFTARETPFMLVMLGQTAVPAHVADFAHRREIPLVGGQSIAPPALHREVFYLLPGVGAHGRMLASFVERDQGAGVAFVLTSPGFEKAAEAIVDGCVQDGWLTRPEVVVLDPQRGYKANLRRLVNQKPQYLFNMGLFDREVSDLARMLEEAELQVTVLSPEALVTPAWLVARSAWKSLLMTTSLHARDLEKGTVVYRELARSQHLPSQPNPARLTALAAAVLIQDALLACGREVSRDVLIRHLERKFRFETGFAPPLSFNPNRRVGADEVFLYTYDHRQKISRYLDALSLQNTPGGP